MFLKILLGLLAACSLWASEFNPAEIRTVEVRLDPVPLSKVRARREIPPIERDKLDLGFSSWRPSFREFAPISAPTLKVSFLTKLARAGNTVFSLRSGVDFAYLQYSRAVTLAGASASDQHRMFLVPLRIGPEISFDTATGFVPFAGFSVLPTFAMANRSFGGELNVYGAILYECAVGGSITVSRVLDLYLRGAQTLGSLSSESLAIRAAEAGVRLFL